MGTEEIEEVMNIAKKSREMTIEDIALLLRAYLKDDRLMVESATEILNLETKED